MSEEFWTQLACGSLSKDLSGDSDEPACGGLSTEDASVHDYSEAMARVSACVRHRAARLQEEAREAGLRVRELMRQPPARRQWMVRNSVRYRSWSIGDRLLEVCRGAWTRSPEAALEWAQLTLYVAQGLDPEVYGSGPVRDLEALALAYVGNCLRLLGDLPEAGRCVRLARSRCAGGSGDQLLAARVLGLWALVLLDEGRASEAASCLEQAQDLYLQSGDDAGLGRILALKGSLLLRSGEPLTASWLLRRALRLVESDADPQLHWNLRYELIHCSLAAGDRQQAVQVLEATLKTLPKDSA
ncbi:MAG: tetratricopeptide repeat protein, partial [Acidobacteria bacterium]|nr:tetratricopeptide repeat protein [Acidobacteriota bacterium]